MPKRALINRRSTVLATCTLLALFLAEAAFAQSLPPSHAKLELIADRPSGEEKILRAGVLFSLDPGWHIYWQNPGDSGTPPKIEWHLPVGYQPGAIEWPTPRRLGSGSVIDYGYENQVLLMAAIFRTTGAANASGSTSADVKYVVCREVCIPGKAHLTVSLAGAAGDPPAEASQWHAIFQSARAQLPKPAPANWKVSAASDKDHFILSVRGASPIKSATFFPLEAGEIENSAPQAFASTGDGFRLTLQKSDQLVKPISKLRGLIVLGQGRAFEIAAPMTQ